jgi:hypothetical protein
MRRSNHATLAKRSVYLLGVAMVGWLGGYMIAVGAALIGPWGHAARWFAASMRNSKGPCCQEAGGRRQEYPVGLASCLHDRVDFGSFRSALWAQLH